MTSSAAAHDLSALQVRLGYAFRQVGLLLQAVTHRSFSADHNERLEFLGDRVLNLMAAEHLLDAYPAAREGDLARLFTHQTICGGEVRRVFAAIKASLQ